MTSTLFPKFYSNNAVAYLEELAAISQCMMLSYTECLFLKVKLWRTKKQKQKTYRLKTITGTF